MNFYKLFSKYVANIFLSDDKKGEFASLVIDEKFIESAANELNVTIDDLIYNLRDELFHKYPNKTLDIDFAIAVISLQLYAASKCETDDEYSANAYNPRLCEIVNCEVGYLQAWYRDNQKRIWDTFYAWCKKNNFLVQECSPREYRNKYIQYPIELAKYILNREDLKYIASKFHKYKIEPFENIFYSDFWEIFDIRIDFRRLNNRIENVLNAVYQDTGSYDSLQSQIYNYFLTWDGEYIDPVEQRTNRVKSDNPFKLHLSDKDGNYRMDIRKDDGALVASIQLGDTSNIELSNYYSFKREGLIIFQRCDSGDLNYWDEIRFIEDKDSVGIAIVFNIFQRNKFYGANALYSYRDIIVYEFEWNNLTSEFYSDGEKSYTLIDGLKVARNIYLNGGEPIWRIHQDCKYLINGKSNSISKGDHILNLPVGEHILKFPKSRDIKITIIEPCGRTTEWTDRQCKWEINKRDNQWRPAVTETGIVGLNFKDYSRIDNSRSILHSWTILNHGTKVNSESNISLKLLNNINQYE